MHYLECGARLCHVRNVYILLLLNFHKPSESGTALNETERLLASVQSGLGQYLTFQLHLHTYWDTLPALSQVAVAVPMLSA